MKTLKVTLKQHTPLIHFQHDQYGATLRASEVKPKLDRFILTRLGNGDYEQGCELARTNKWLIGEKKALNYKISIVPYEPKDVSLKITEKNGKFETEIFPMILSNMGGKDNREELMNLSLYNYVVATIVTLHDSLIDELRRYLPLFFAFTNFGQRQTKGFGSFTVYRFDNENPIGWNPADYYEQGCPYMAFALENENKLNDKERQKKIFEVLDFYWKCLKAGVNYTGKDNKYPGRYIKSFLYCFLNKKKLTWEKREIKQHFPYLAKDRKNVVPNSNQAIFARGLLGCPDKYSYGNNKEVRVEHIAPEEKYKIDRIPTPIYFKPVCFDNDCYVYVLFDVSITSNIVSIPKENRKFRMSYNGKSFNLDLFLFIGSKSYSGFINDFHEYLSTNEQVLSALYENSSKETYIDLNKEELCNDDLAFVPRDFNWRDILKDRNCVIFNNVE